MAGLTNILGLAGAASPLGVVGAGASALYGIIKGVSAGIQARKLEKNNIRPIAQVNQNFLQNVGQAGLMAQTGLANRVYNNSLTGLNTGLTSGLRQAGRSGGTGSIASILRGYGAGVNNLNAQDQQAQQQNQRLLMQQRGILAQDQQRVWQWNKASPFMEASQRIASLRNAGNQNVFGGIQALGNVAGLMKRQEPSTTPKVDIAPEPSGLTGNVTQSQNPYLARKIQNYLDQQAQNSLLTGNGMMPLPPNA